MLGKRRQRCLRKQWRNDNRGIFRTHGAGACTVVKWIWYLDLA